MADQDLGNAITRRQLYLERYANGLTNRTVSGSYDTVESILFNPKLSQTQKKNRINKTISTLRDENKKTFIADIKKFWAAEIKWMQTWLPDEVEVPKVNTTKLINSALSKPLVDSGGLSSQELNNRAWDSASEQTEALIRSSVYYDLTRNEIEQQFNAIKAQFDRGIKASVRTGVFSVANEVRETMYQANDDIVLGVVMAAVLDGRTTLFCLNIDGEILPLDSSLRPPFHVNCRTIALPVFEGETEEDIKKTLENRVQVDPGDNYKKGDNTAKTTRTNLSDGVVEVKSKTKSSQSGANFLASQVNSGVGRQFLADSMGVKNSKEFIEDIRDGKSPKVSLRNILNEQSDLDVNGLIEREKQ